MSGFGWVLTGFVVVPVGFIASYSAVTLIRDRNAQGRAKK